MCALELKKIGRIFKKDTKTKLETEKETVKDDTTKLLQLAESEFDHLVSTTGDIKDVVEKSYCRI